MERHLHRQQGRRTEPVQTQPSAGFDARQAQRSVPDHPATQQGRSVEPDHEEGRVAVVVGPEVLAGSTRLKAGTATKLVLNTLTTGAMVRLGKTYGNLMVDLQASNAKLVGRARRILQRLSDLDEAAAGELLTACDGELKTAILVARLGIDVTDARQRLATVGGRLRAALGDDA